MHCTLQSIRVALHKCRNISQNSSTFSSIDWTSEENSCAVEESQSRPNSLDMLVYNSDTVTILKT